VTIRGVSSKQLRPFASPQTNSTQPDPEPALFSTQKPGFLGGFDAPAGVEVESVLGEGPPLG
jgi:hypothetical protein